MQVTMMVYVLISIEWYRIQKIEKFEPWFVEPALSQGKILVNEILRNNHQTSIEVGLLFMKSLPPSYEMWFRKVKKNAFFIIEILEGPSDQEKENLKNWISQEPRVIKSDATYHHSIDIHLCQMTSNFKISRDKNFLGIVGESP